MAGRAAATPGSCPQRFLPQSLASVAASDGVLLVSADAKVALKGVTSADKPPPQGSTSLFHERVVEDHTVFHKHARIRFYKLMNGIVSLAAPHKRDRRRDGAEN